MYYFIILICNVIICVVNALVFKNTSVSIATIILLSVSLTILVIIVDGIFAFIIRWLMPKILYSVDKKRFMAGDKIRRFYEFIGVKVWKDKVLELGIFTGFSKRKILEPKNVEYVKRFIEECNYGVGVHFICMLTGFLIIIPCPNTFKISIAMPVAIVNLVLNYMPYAVLRYNLKKLRKLYELNLKLESNK